MGPAKRRVGHRGKGTKWACLASKGKLKGRPKDRKQGVEKMERNWDDRGQLTLLMAFQFCVFPPGHSPKTRWKRCAPLCTAVCGCVCARALVTHAKSLPIPEGELLLPWTTSIPYECHKHHYFQERCQWQLCWLTLVVSVAWWPVAAGPGADISVSRFQSCLQMSKFKDGDVSPSTGFPCSKTRERESLLDPVPSPVVGL